MKGQVTEMGLAAAQARLLSITSRMSDNELRAQLINNKKIRLSNESARASERYLNALNNAKLMFRNYDGENVEANQQLTFNALTTYGPYNTQYGLINSNGQMLVSEEMANIFEASGGDLKKFLKSYGLEKTSHFFESIINKYGNDETVQNVMQSLGIDEMTDENKAQAIQKLEGAYDKYLQTIASKNYQAVELNINNTIDELTNWDNTVVYPGLDAFYKDMYDTMAEKETFSDVAGQYMSLYNSLDNTGNISFTYKNNPIKFMKSIQSVDSANAYIEALKDIPKFHEGAYEFDSNVYGIRESDGELIAGSLQSGNSAGCTINHEHVHISDDAICHEIAEYGYTPFGHLGADGTPAITTDTDGYCFVNPTDPTDPTYKSVQTEINRFNSYTYNFENMDPNEVLYNNLKDYMTHHDGLGQSFNKAFSNSYEYISSEIDGLPQFKLNFYYECRQRWESDNTSFINNVSLYYKDGSNWVAIPSSSFLVSPSGTHYTDSNDYSLTGGNFAITLTGMFSDLSKSTGGSDTIQFTLCQRGFRTSPLGNDQWYYGNIVDAIYMNYKEVSGKEEYKIINSAVEDYSDTVAGTTIKINNNNAYSDISASPSVLPNLLTDNYPVLYEKVYQKNSDGNDVYTLRFYGLAAGDSDSNNSVDAYTKTLIWEGTPEEYEQMIIEQIKNNYFATLNEFITRAINDTNLINYDETTIAKILNPYLFEDSDTSTNYELSKFFKKPSGDSSTTGYINEYFERINGVWKFQPKWENNANFTNTGKDIAQAFLLNDLFNKFGDPTWSWVDTADKNYGDADAKVQWYTNIFNRMKNEGYQVLLDGLAASAQWIENALESGLVTMTQIDSENNWKNIGYANCADITEQTDDYAVTLAEAEYKMAMQKIQAKDQRFDMELKNIDTEHSALQNEMDSIKTAMNKHIERSFKYFG